MAGEHATDEDAWSDPLPDATWTDPWDDHEDGVPTAGARRRPATVGSSHPPRLRELVEQIRPVAFAHERTLPVLPALEALLPDGGLRRGVTVQVAGGAGATALALALVAGPTQAGSWAACVGVPEVGWAAAGELGVALERIVVVRPGAPGPSGSGASGSEGGGSGSGGWATVLAALVDAFDVVVCGPEQAPSATEVRRLTARARERGAVVVAVGGPAGLHARRAWPGADVHLRVVAADWSGPGQGWGHLAARRATVEAEGRRGLDRPRRAELWLPGPDGVAPVERSETSGDMGTSRGMDADTVVPRRRRAG
jgi:hypothetical protein